MLSEFLKVTHFVRIHLFLKPSLLEKRLKGDYFMQTSCGGLFPQRIILTILNHLLCCCSVTKSFPTLWPHGLQHAKLCWSTLFSRVYSKSCPLSRHCQPAISSSVAPFFSCPQSFPLQYSCLESPMDGGAGRLQSMGLLRVRHDWAASLSLFTFMLWGRKWHPTPVFLPGESQGWGSLVGCRLWVVQSRTQLKRLSSSSSSNLSQH